jgi:hypothetical protein
MQSDPGISVKLTASQGSRDTGQGTGTRIMACDHHHGEGGANASRRPPEWADGLKQLYDSVVEEDLPDTFRELIDRLDSIDFSRLRDGTGADGAASAQDRDSAS